MLRPLVEGARHVRDPQHGDLALARVEFGAHQDLAREIEERAEARGRCGHHAEDV
jgi:hypothetical protein